MNHPTPDEFERHADRAVGPVFASPARRRAMREELLAHLAASFDEELARPGALHDNAASSALHRLGDPADLRHQLQDSVPLIERLVFQSLSKETLMSRWMWFLAVFAFFFGPSIVLPALAQHKQHGAPWPDVAFPLVIGLAITLAGVAMIAYGALRRRAA